MSKELYDMVIDVQRALEMLQEIFCMKTKCKKCPLNTGYSCVAKRLEEHFPGKLQTDEKKCCYTCKHLRNRSADPWYPIYRCARLGRAKKKERKIKSIAGWCPSYKEGDELLKKVR